MAVNEKFPVPVSGQPIPKGWFARLVRFINSLVLSGDNQYVLVKRTDGGTTITLTPSFVNDLKNAAAAPAAGGGGNWFDPFGRTAATFNANSDYVTPSNGLLHVWTSVSIPVSATSGGGETSVYLSRSGQSYSFEILGVSTENTSGVLDKTFGSHFVLQVAAGVTIRVRTLAASTSTIFANCYFVT